MRLKGKFPEAVALTKGVSLEGVTPGVGLATLTPTGKAGVTVDLPESEPQSPSIRWLTFSGFSAASPGIVVENGAPVVQRNSIDYLTNKSLTKVVATCNWWSGAGHTGRVRGHVFSDPFLTDSDLSMTSPCIPTVSFDLPLLSTVLEGDSGLDPVEGINVSLNGPIDVAASVTWATKVDPLGHAVPANALGVGDFKTASGRLTFAPTEMTKEIQVSVVGDKTREGVEDFLLKLTGGPAIIGDRDVHTILIQDND